MPAVTGSTGGHQTSTTTLTFAHTSDGNVLYVTTSGVGPTLASSVTYGGVSLFLIGRTSGQSMSNDWWYLPQPTAGTANIVVTYPGVCNAGAVARNVSGVDLNGVFRNLTSANGNSTAPAVTIASNTGDLVLDAVSTTAINTTFTAGGSQTVDVVQNSINDVSVKFGASHSAGAASVSMSWTLSVSGGWLAAGLSIPAAGTLPPIAERITQLVAETVTAQPPGVPYATQLVAETITLQPAGVPRTTQLVVETVTPNVAVAASTSATQLVAEVVTQLPPPVPKVTQLVAEVLTWLPLVAANAKATQLVAEVLAPVIPNPVVTQLVAEVLTAPTKASLTQLVTETLTMVTKATATQLVAEVLTAIPPPIYVTQLSVEVFVPIPHSPAVVTHVIAELVTPQDYPAVKVTQLLCELIVVPRPVACAPPFPIDPPTDAAAARGPSQTSVTVPPTNLTPETAYDLTGQLPFTGTQNPGSSPSDVWWFKYTFQPGEFGLSVYAPWTGGSQYYPDTSLYIGFPTDLDNWTVMNSAVTCQIFNEAAPGVSGGTIYIRLRNVYGGVPDSLVTLQVVIAPNTALPSGSVVITDDASGYPLVIFSPDGAGVRQMRPFVAGEVADVLPSGISLWENEQDSANLYLYDPTLTVLTLVPWPRYFSIEQPISTNRRDRFYIGAYFNSGAGGPGGPAKVTTVTSAGALGPTTWSIPFPVLAGMAPSPDETILYVKQDSTGIYRYHLASGTLESTQFLTAPSGWAFNGVFGHEFLVLPDGSLLVGVIAGDHTSPSYVARYSAAGALLQTYSLGSGTIQYNHIAHAPDDLSFWVWAFTDDSAKESIFLQIRLSDGAILESWKAMVMRDGAAFLEPQPGDVPNFGSAPSCPMVVLPQALAPYGNAPPRPVEAVCPVVFPITPIWTETS